MADPSNMFAMPNAGAMFAQSFQQGMEQNTERAKKAAMAALMADPNNTRAMEALARLDPSTAMQFKQQQQQSHMAALDQHRDSIIKGAQIVRQLKPHDQASWDQTRAMAAQAGIPMDEVPPSWDGQTEQYVQGLVGLADTFAPQTPHNGQLVPFTPGGGVARINPETGQLETLIAPNDGGQQAGAPVGGGMPHVSDEATYNAVPPGAQYVGPDGHVRVKQGGAGGNVSGGFPN